MSEFWQCPNCRAVLTKGNPGLRFYKSVIGAATCGGCGSSFSQSAIYAGKYDISAFEALKQYDDKIS